MSLGFSPDGSRLASGALDGTFKLWGTAEERLIATVHDTGLSAAEGTASDVRWQTQFSADGMSLATISNPAGFQRDLSEPFNGVPRDTLVVPWPYPVLGSQGEPEA